MQTEPTRVELASPPGQQPRQLSPARRVTLLALNAAALALLAFIGLRAATRPLAFDDAFMFQRYAIHLWQGLGISWNADAVPTGGMTSLGWFLVMCPLGLLPVAHGYPLALASFLVGLLSLLGLTRAVTRLSSSLQLRRFWLVFPLLSIPLLINHPFRYNLVTGMDTMLSFAANAALSCALWRASTARELTRHVAILLGALAVATVLVRPENGLFAVLAPALAAALLFPPSQRRRLLWTAGTFLVLLTLAAFLYHAYFRAWLPLSFYMKVHHAYRGYIGIWNSTEFLGSVLWLIVLVLAFPLACLSRRSAHIAITFLVPVALVFAYLETVTQIMAMEARYYVPFLAPVLVAACWMTDLALQSPWRLTLRARRPGLIVSAGLILLLAISWPALVRRSGRHPVTMAYPQPHLHTAASTALPQVSWFDTITTLANVVVKPLPAGSSIAASEVGLLGATAPQVNIIDLVGLNDNQIALNGFSMDRLLDRKPLLIWFPHSDYTWQRQTMFCSPRLLNEYTLLGGDAFNYSLAVRRNLPSSPEMMQHVRDAFSRIYPNVSLETYVVTSIACPATPPATLALPRG